MIDADMTDKEIIKDREKKYGPANSCFNTWSQMCELLRAYHKEAGNTNTAHLYALNMALLKIVRSAWNPSIGDNYKDGRNYITIAKDASEVKHD